MTTSLAVDRAQILAFRRNVGALDERLPKGRRALRRVARAGLQDSMPRAAVLSIHARMKGTKSDAWADPALVQVWGPRFSAFVIAKQDVAVFTLSRLPEKGPRRQRAEVAADRLDELLGDETMTVGEAGRALGVSPNSLRYATLTGRVLIRWDGARQPTIRMVPPPDMSPAEALLELARRHLHVFGPSTPESFKAWAGVPVRRAVEVFDALEALVVPVRTPLGDAWVLASDVDTLRSASGAPALARLLPSGDAYYLLQGSDRDLLVPDPQLRDQLWTSRVWPGAILSKGEIVGTWRRAKTRVVLTPWRRLPRQVREAIAAEAETFPLPDAGDGITVTWDE